MVKREKKIIVFSLSLVLLVLVAYVVYNLIINKGVHSTMLDNIGDNSDLVKCDGKEYDDYDYKKDNWNASIVETDNKYVNKDIESGLKPAFASPIYGMFKSKGKESYYLVGFDLGGGFLFDYVYNSGESSEPEEEYACYNKYKYKNGYLVLYKNRYPDNEDCKKQPRKKKIRVVEFVEDKEKAELVLEIHDRELVLTAERQDLKLINADVKGEYEKRYKCSKSTNDSKYKNIVEKIVLSDDGKGYFKINNKKIKIHYNTYQLIDDDYGENSSWRIQNVVDIYSTGMGVYLKLYIKNGGFSDSSGATPQYHKIK